MDTTSVNARPVPAPINSERRFLEDQAANAKTAMIQTLHELKQTAMRVADVRACARQHPWLVTGSAVAAGFAAGALYPPASRKETGMATPVSASNRVPGEHEQQSQRTGKSSWSSGVGAALTTAAITVLQGALTAAAVSLFRTDQAAVGPAPVRQSTESGDLRNGSEC